MTRFPVIRRKFHSPGRGFVPLLGAMTVRWLLGCVLGLGVALAADPKPEDARQLALDAWKAGKRDEAVALVSKAISEHPKDGRLLHMRAQMRLVLKDGKGALNDLDAAIAVDGDSAFLHQERAQLRFRAGLIADSVADFDKANELAPKLAPQNWQRGIALYYAGRFADGRKQFELHQTVNPQDVENAAWHFLCVARTDGVAAARQGLIKVEQDGRVPMREVQKLFAGEGTVEEVFAAAKAGEPTPAGLKANEFYAHLYVGLFYEALNDAAKTKEHIEAAAKLAAPDNYMGDVARVHAVRLNLSTTPSAKP